MMTTSSPAVVAAIVGFGVFLWLGVYLLVRAPRSRLILVSVGGLLAQAAFFFASALTDTAGDPLLLAWLERAFWWATVAPLAAWHHYSSMVARRIAGGAPDRAAVGLVYVAAALVIAMGTATDLFVRYTEVTATGPMRVRPGPAYGLYVALQLLAGGGALVNFGRAYRAALRGAPPLRPLALLLSVGALLFLAGALWLSVSWGWSLALSPLPGNLLLLAGLAAFAYGSVSSGMLLEGQHIRRDFLYSLTGLTLLNLLYVTLLVAAGAGSTPALLALVGLVTLTHMTLDQARTLLDRLFFSAAEREARAEARDYAALLSTTPVPPLAEPGPAAQPEEAPRPVLGGAEVEPATPAGGKAFQDQVRRALTGLKSPPKLAQSPLLALRLVERRLARGGQEDNRLNRAAALREILIEAIEGLRPDGADPGPAHQVGEAWRFYNVLHYPYVRELSRKSALQEARRLEQERRRAGRREPDELEQVLAWLADLDEDTYYKWQRRASDTIALILWEEEQKALSAEA
jgi:hypothetical protein